MRIKLLHTGIKGLLSALNWISADPTGYLIWSKTQISLSLFLLLSRLLLKNKMRACLRGMILI